MSDLNFLSAVVMADLVRQREISPIELVDAHFARIAELNPRLNAFVALDEERARRDARTLEAESGGNDPTMTAVNGAYTAMWNSYLNDELKFISTSAFTDLNDQTFVHWDFGHIDPTGAQKGKDARGNVILYTAGDLAATMALNVDLKVLSANGYYDSVTPFYQTMLDLQNMPLIDTDIRKNLTIKFYPSGHMVYLDGNSRTAMKADLAAFYDSTTTDRPAMARILMLQEKKRHMR